MGCPPVVSFALPGPTLLIILGVLVAGSGDCSALPSGFARLIAGTIQLERDDSGNRHGDSIVVTAELLVTALHHELMKSETLNITCVHNMKVSLFIYIAGTIKG